MSAPAKVGSNRDPSMHLAADGCNHDPQVPLDHKVKYLFLAAAKRLARWDKGDCHTHAATKSLSSAAPDPKFRRNLSAATRIVVVVDLAAAAGCGVKRAKSVEAQWEREVGR